MNMKQTLIFLLVVAIVPCIVAGLKKNAASNAKRKTQTRVLCPTQYSAYVKNCTTNFDAGIENCGVEEETETLKLKETSAKDRENLELDGANSCQAVIGCDDGGEDINVIFDCITQQSLKSSMSIKNTSYKASVFQLNYDRKKLAIEEKLSACTNSTTEELDEKTNAALDALTICFRTGKWGLVELVPAVPELTPAVVDPAIAEYPEASVVSENLAHPTRTKNIIKESETVERTVEAAVPGPE